MQPQDLLGSQNSHRHRAQPLAAGDYPAIGRARNQRAPEKNADLGASPADETAWNRLWRPHGHSSVSLPLDTFPTDMGGFRVQAANGTGTSAARRSFRLSPRTRRRLQSCYQTSSSSRW